MRTALLALLLAPAAALAQSTTFTLTAAEATGTPPQIYVGKSNCATELLHFSWDVSVGHPTTAEEVDIVRARSASTCNSTSVTDPDKDEIAPSQSETGTETVAAKDMILDADGGLPGGCDNTDRGSANPYTTFYCVQLKSTSAISGSQVVSQAIPVNFATAPPTPPAALVVEPGDQHLRIDWSPGNTSENIAYYDVHVLAPGDVLDTSKYADRVNQQTNADVSHTDEGAPLQNELPDGGGVPYQVSVIATDVYGNVSATSQPVTATPVAVLDFYNLYRQDGGDATGGRGCSTAGTATWLVLLAVAAGLWARRRKGSAALLLLLGLLAPAARAEERPARRLLVGFKVDRYDPKIDSEADLNGQQPYHQIFGARAPLRYQLEVDWEVWHPLGSVLLGATAGFWQNYGKGIDATTGLKSADTALLDVVPLGIVATYRFDWLADRWPRFPLIPYAQAGLMRALWASFSGTGAVSKDTTHGGRGSGWTYGYNTALGFALNLESVDPDLSREAYVDTSIQRTSLFAEYGWTRLDDFHKSGALILTDRAWRFGLAVEF